MTLNAAVFDLPLTKISRAVVAEGFIAGQVLTPVNTANYTGKLPYYDKEHLRIETTIAGPEGDFNLIRASAILSDTYNIDDHGLRDILHAKDYANYPDGWDCEADRVAFLTSKIKLSEERALAQLLASTAVLTNNVTLSGTSQYSHASGGNPIGDFKTAIDSIVAATGHRPNKVIVPYKTISALSINAQIRDLYKYTNSESGVVSDKILSYVLGGGAPIKVLTPMALFNNSVTGQADNLQYVWGNDIIYMYAPETPGMMQPTVGYKVSLKVKSGPKEINGGTSDKPVVYKNSLVSPPESTLVQVVRKYDDIIADPTAAYLIKDPIA